MAKAPIYKQYAHNPAANRIQAIQEIANQLKGQCPDEMCAKASPSGQNGWSSSS